MHHLSTDEELAAVEAMHQSYNRLRELGWQDISRFKPKTIPFGSAPFLGIEFGGKRPIECEFHGRNDAGANIFTTSNNDDNDVPKKEEKLVMFRHYKR